MAAPVRPEIDETDQALVRMLQDNGRATYAELAAGLKMNAESVRDRLHRLISDGLVKVTTSVSPAVLGYSLLALVAIKVRGSARLVAEKLAELPTADFVVCTAGSADILVELICTDGRQLLTVLDEEIRGLDGVTDVVVYQYLTAEKYAPSSAGAPLLAVNAPGDTGNPDNPPAPLDDTDRRLVRLLQEDGRASITELAEEVDHPYSTVRRRVLRLFRSGLVRTLTLTDPLRYGARAQAGVFVRVHGALPPVVDAMREMPGVDLVVAATGPFDLLLEVTCASQAELTELVGDRLRSLPGVAFTETFTYLHILKLPYAWSSLGR
jgi:DNA-binding Lrp family transcriptional regulator